MASGGYDFVAEALFNELDVDGFFLEYDDERSGGFEPLRFVPPGKQVVLGLVTTKRPELESKDELKRRIDEAAKYVPLDQLCLSGQCGFASTEQGNALTADDQKAKLELIVSVADEVWGKRETLSRFSPCRGNARQAAVPEDAPRSVTHVRRRAGEQCRREGKRGQRAYPQGQCGARGGADDHGGDREQAAAQRGPRAVLPLERPPGCRRRGR